jgi:usherin
MYFVFCKIKTYTSLFLFFSFFNKTTFRFTTYEYKLLVHNSMGFTPSQETTITTLAGLPRRGADLTARVLSLTAIDVRWAQQSK